MPEDSQLSKLVLDRLEREFFAQHPTLDRLKSRYVFQAAARLGYKANQDEIARLEHTLERAINRSGLPLYEVNSAR